MAVMNSAFNGKSRLESNLVCVRSGKMAPQAMRNLPLSIYIGVRQYFNQFAFPPGKAT